MRYKFYFLTFLLLGTSFLSVQAQGSLEDRVRAMPDDSAKVNYLHTLVDSLRERSSRQALFFAIEGKGIADRIGYKQGSLYMLESISWMHYRNNDLLNALQAAQAALGIANELGEQPAVAKCLIGIAAIYFEEKKYQKAIEHFKEAGRIGKEVGNTATYGRAMNNIGFSFIYLKKYDSATFYSNLSLAAAQEIGDPYIEGFALRNFGEIATAQNNVEVAIQHYKNGLELADNSSNSYLKISLLYRLGGAYNLLKKPILSIPVLKEAILIGEKHGYKDELERALKSIAESYTQLNDFKSAYNYQSRFVKLHDTLETHRKEEQLSVAQATFDLERKQSQIEILTRDAALQQEAYNRQRLLTYTFVGCAILLLIFITVLWFNNKRLHAAKRIVDFKNQEIKKQTTLLRETNATKDKLFSIISHDLRSPIAGMKSLMELISRHGLTQEEFIQVSQSLRKNIDSVYDDMDNLLQWAQSQLNGLRQTKEHFPLHRLVKDKMHLFQEVANAKSVLLVNSVEEDLSLYADKNQMGLVLRNLIANGVKFSSQGGMLEISAVRGATSVTIEIKDRGVGMTDKDLVNLFHKETHFSRRGTNNEKGIGLGLILTKEFVEANGGSISVVSEVGKGTVFSIRLDNQPKLMEETTLVA